MKKHGGKGMRGYGDTGMGNGEVMKLRSYEVGKKIRSISADLCGICGFGCKPK
jgi:hypothetical protein